MKIWEFSSYDDYLRAQSRGTKRRRKREQKASVDQREANALSTYKPEADFVLCHGAGVGTEVSLLRAKYPNAKVLGTDLIPWGDGCVVWDFNKPNPEWNRNVDLIYTNSLDHSPNPKETLEVWSEQLTDEGVLCVSWDLRHAWLLGLEKLYMGGDCFATHLDEFIQVIDNSLQVLNLLFIPKHEKTGFRVLVIAKRRG